MSDMTENAAAAETAPEADGGSEQLPADHPLVKALAAQKATIKELKSNLESEAAGVPSKVAAGLRAHLVELHGIDPEDAELFLTATDPELLLKQVNRLIGPDKQNRKNYVPGEGRNPNAEPTSDLKEFARNLFGT